MHCAGIYSTRENISNTPVFRKAIRYNFREGQTGKEEHKQWVISLTAFSTGMRRKIYRYMKQKQTKKQVYVYSI